MKTKRLVEALCIGIFCLSIGFISKYQTDTMQFENPISEENTIFSTYEVELSKIDADTDSDYDGVPDWIENTIGSDSTMSDTDGDGLSDYEELFELNSSPIKIDSNDDGISDAYEDFDEDTLNNIDEIMHETNPLSRDTDGDGLSDSDEISYNTDPLNDDTDGDGVSDGWEVLHQYEPLNYNEIFEVNESIEDDTITVMLNINLAGDYVESVSIEKNQDIVLLNREMPGYMGAAYDFSLDGTEFEKATISFSFDETQYNEYDLNPVIYYYNEDSQLLEELETTVIGNVASAVVSHFSTYILLNKTDFDSAWDLSFKEQKYDADGNLNAMDFVFVFDYSHSMVKNDPNQLCKEISKNFVKKLRNGYDQASIVKFIRTANCVSELTSDKDVIYQSIDSIVYDNGKTENSGTNGASGIAVALTQLETSTADSKYIIFLTDGQDNFSTYSYDALISRAQDNNVNIYSIGLGEASEDVLKKLADETNGKYYYASDDEYDDTYSLNEIYEDISLETLDSMIDSNNDGISDYDTKLLCEGKLTTGTGIQLFSGISYDDIQENNDYDGDGKLNGEELVISNSSDTKYIKVISSPVLSDSDGDGIDDYEDTAPLKKGLLEGVIGRLSLVSYYKSEESGYFAGHVFFVYTSYINDIVDFSSLKMGWSRLDESEIWASDNYQQDDSPQTDYEFSVGESVSIGNGALSASDSDFFDSEDWIESSSGGLLQTANGVCYNMEICKYILQGRDYAVNTYVEQDITEENLYDIISYCGQDSVNYWSLTHNCAEVACQAWNLISDITADPYSENFLRGEIATPKGLKENLRELSECGENYSFVEAINK